MKHSLAMLAVGLLVSCAGSDCRMVDVRGAPHGLEMDVPPAGDPLADLIQTMVATPLSPPSAEGSWRLGLPPQDTDAAFEAGVEPHTDSEPWEFSLRPFIWVPGMSGDVSVRGNESSFDYDPLEMAESVVDNFDGAAALEFGLRKGAWSIEATGVLVGLRNDQSMGPIDIEVEFDMAILQLKGGYRVARIPLDHEEEGGAALSLDAQVGVRYLHLEPEVRLDPGPSSSTTKNWVDPVVGAHARLDITEALALNVIGDIGGFGVGSDLTWYLRTGLVWNVSSSFSFAAGYIWLDVDYEEGNDPDDFRFDVLFYGPYLAGLIRF